LASTHPYFIADLEGYVMLDASRAVSNVFNANLLPNSMARPMDAVFFAGYSQGGHGAFAGDRLLLDYAPDVPLKGTIGHAIAPDVEALLRERPSLAPYIVYAYRDFYGLGIVDPTELFLPQWIENFSHDASTKCVDEVYRYYPSAAQQMYKPEFIDALYGDRLGELYPEFKAVLDENHVGHATNTDVPALLLHGAIDPIVTAKTAETFLHQVCSLGKSVTYRLYPDVNHFLVRQNSFRDTLEWMQAVLYDVPQRNDCLTIGG
jgi:pimeloyl-ACP methyl ester carboxylesterase